MAVDNASGQRQYTQGWANLTCTEGLPDVTLLFDIGDFTSDDWTVGFDLAVLQDFAVQLPFVQELPPPTGRFALDSVTNIVDLEIRVEPNLNGELVRMRAYSSAQCWRHIVIYTTTLPLTNGQAQSLTDLPDLASGTWFLTLEGYDNSDLPFYDLVEVIIP